MLFILLLLVKLKSKNLNIIINNNSQRLLKLRHGHDGPGGCKTSEVTTPN